MEKIVLKTNFKCQGCVDKTANVLNQEPQIKSWKADVSTPTKTLEVETSLSKEQLIKLVEKAGYKAE